MPDEIVEGATPETQPNTPATPDPTTPSNTPTGEKPTGFVYKEDRSKWVPNHRFNEVSQKNQTYATQLAERDRQIAALTNTRTQAPEETEQAAIREALEKVYPALKRFGTLSDEQITQLFSAPESVARQEQQERSRWTDHAATQVDKLSDLVAGHLGADSLNEDQRDDLSEAFRRYVLAKHKSEMESEGVSKTSQRYERGDESLLKEFSDRYTKNWFEPARRKVTSSELSRNKRVPQSTARGAVSSVQKPAAFKTLDERIEYGFKLAKERGAEFNNGRS